jgi:TRAP-type C4-dicarboxylate transport system permease large subunit
VPAAFGNWVAGNLDTAFAFLLGVNVFLFLIGMFIETGAAIVVLAPILAPVAVQFGIDPVHFGIIMVVNLALGMITPPFGVNLFAACTVAKISYDEIIPVIIPYVAVVVACLAVVTAVPELSLWLRDLVYR